MDLASKYGKVSDVSESIDELIAETSLGAQSTRGGASQGSGEFSRFDDLFIPFPEITNLSKVSHQASQSESESRDESKLVSKAIDKIDNELEVKRARLGTQLDYLGFSDWRDKLEQNPDLNIEDLVSQEYKEWDGDLDNEELLSKIQESKLGGAFSNLKKDLQAWDDLSYTGSFFSMFTGHRGGLLTQIDSSKNIVKSRLKTIKEFSKAIQSAKDDLDYSKQRKIDRDQAVVLAHKYHASGDLENAQIQSIKADSITNVMKTKLLNANELLGASHKVDYSGLSSELFKSQERWKKVDANYETTLIYTEGISKAMIIAPAVALGMIVAPAGAAALTAWGMWAGAATLVSTAVATTVIGGALSYLRTSLKGMSSEAQGVDFNWQTEYKDAYHTTCDIGLMGLGGGVMSGGKVLLGIGMNATRVTAGSGLLTRSWHWIKGGADSAITSMGMSLPSTLWYGSKEYNQMAADVDKMLSDDYLSDKEIEYITARKLLHYGEEKLGADYLADHQTGFDKEVLRRALLKEGAMNLCWVNGLDMTMNGLCGFLGHSLAGVRANHLKGMMPKVPSANVVPKVDFKTGVKAATGRQLANVNVLSTHAVDVLMSKVSADINLDARQRYLGQEASEQDVARAYSMAFASTLIGNVQGDFQAFTNRAATNFHEQAQADIDQFVKNDIKSSGIKLENDPRFLAAHDSGSNGLSHKVDLGHTLREMELRGVSKKILVEDELATIYEKALGNPNLKNMKQVKEFLDNTIDSITSKTKYSNSDKKAFKKTLLELFPRDYNRQSRVKVDDTALAKEQLGLYTERLKHLSAESEIAYSRYKRGEGRDKFGLMNTAQEYVKSFGLKFKNKNSRLHRLQNYLADSSVIRGVKSLNKFPVLGPTASMLTKFTYHASRRIFVEAPLAKGFITYSGLGSAGLAHGVGGVFVYTLASMGLAKHLGFAASRKLGLNRVRPMDSAEAFSNKVQLEKIVNETKKLLELRPELLTSKKQLLDTEMRMSDAEAQIGKMNKMFSECAQPRRKILFEAAGFAALMYQGISGAGLIWGAHLSVKYLGKFKTAVLGLGFMGAAPYLGYPVLGLANPVFGVAAVSLVGAYALGKTVTSIPFVKTRLADFYTGTANRLMSQGPVARVLKGDSIFHTAAIIASPLAFPVVGWWALAGTAGFALWKNNGQSIAEGGASILLRQRETLLGNKIEDKFSTNQLGELQQAYLKSISGAEGYSHLKMFKAVEDQLVTQLTSKKAKIGDFVDTLDVVFKEMDAPIRDQILYRLSVVADVDLISPKEMSKIDQQIAAGNVPKELVGRTPEEQKRIIIEILKRKAQGELNNIEKLKNTDPQAAKLKLEQAREDRLIRLKTAFGGDIARLDDGGRQPHQGNISSDKLNLLRSLIKEVADSTPTKSPDFESHLKSLRKENSRGISSGDVYLRSVDGALDRVVSKIFDSQDLNLTAVDAYLKKKESISSFADIQSYLSPKLNKKGELKGKLVQIGKKELELRDKVKELKKDNKPYQELVTQADKLKDLRNHLEKYVLERQNLIELSLGKKETASLEVMQKIVAEQAERATWPVGISSKEQYLAMRARIGKKFEATKVGRDQDGNEIRVFDFDLDQAPMSRREQNKKLEELTQRLDALQASSDEKIKILDTIRTNLDNSKRTEIKKIVDEFIESPSGISLRMRNLASVAKNGLKYKSADGKEVVVDSINPTKRAKELINNQDIELGIKRFSSWKHYLKPSAWGQRVSDFTEFSQTRVKKHAESSNKLGVFTAGDVNKLARNLINDPTIALNIDNGRARAMRAYAKEASSPALTSIQKRNAEMSLKNLISRDLDYVVNFYKTHEQRRARAYSDIMQVHSAAYEIDKGKSASLNANRIKEILDSAKQELRSRDSRYQQDEYSVDLNLRLFKIQILKNKYYGRIPLLNIPFPRMIKNIFTMKMPKIVASGESASIWHDTTADYKGFGSKNSGKNQMPEKYSSLDTSLSAPDKSAYAENFFLRQLGGPVRDYGLYGDSSFMRLIAWPLKRLASPRGRVL